jgi:SAM-dependent methyltransferase
MRSPRAIIDESARASTDLFSSRMDARLLAALAGVSATVTAQQIALLQVLGWMHWHHFAYLVVALALLGFGIAGTILSLAREPLLRRAPRLLPWLLLAVAASIPLGVRLAQHGALAVDLPLVFFAPRNVWRMATLCLLLLPPFLLGGLATGLVLTAQARRAGRFYAASLAGAGVGGLVGLAFVAHLIPPVLPAAVATLALAATACLWPQLTVPARAAGFAVTALVALSWASPGDLNSSQFKPLQRTLDLPGARIVASRPGVHGWVQIVSAPALRPSPAVGFEFLEEIPPQPAVFVNGLPYGSLVPGDSAELAPWLDSTTDAAAFVGTRPQRVLMLENGPGGWAALAARHGAQQITVVEPNNALIGLLAADGATPAAEWQLPAVTLQRTSARRFLRRTEDRFDVIRFPEVGAFGGSAGLAAASEQFLLTREAFEEAWQRLTPGGVIAVTAWMDFPERNPLRLLATLAEMLEVAGVRPRDHLAGIRGWSTVTFLVRRTPWTAELANQLRRFSADGGFDPLLLPEVTAAERESHHAWQNRGFFEQVDALVDGPREPQYREYAFRLRPATDQRPYFSQFLRHEKIRELRELFGARAMPFFELGSLVVALAFGLLAVLALVCIVLPLARLGWRGPGKTRVLMYFGGLGMGFMLVEIGLILQAHAWLGSPVAGVALVLTTLLIASGAGSLWSERLDPGAATQVRVLILIAVGILVAAALVIGMQPIANRWPLGAQAALLVAIVAALGAPMGMAFPLGLRALEGPAPPHVPWAWAVNGSVSVVTPSGAMLLAMSAGFGALFVAAACAYALAIAGIWLTGGPRSASRRAP